MSTGESLAVRVEVASQPDADEVRLEELAASLRRELIELDVAAVERVDEDSVPAGAKVGEAFALAALVVTIAKTAGSLAAVVRALQEWAARGGRSVKLDVDGDTIEISGASREQQDRLIAAWIDKQALR